MRPWRLAESLKVLRVQINARAPKRSKASDGTIGDTRHRSRASDHNAYIIDGSYGVVSAMDITHDPKHGMDAYALAETLRLNEDERVKYIISNKKIAESKRGFEWRAYHGINPHNKHTHISVKPIKTLYDSTEPWLIETSVTRAILPEHYEIRLGDIGAAVVELQERLNVKHTGIFDPETDAAVRAFQKATGLKPDGIVGPLTWAKLAVRPSVASPGKFKGSAYAVAWAKTFESFQSEAYDDNGAITIGWGHSSSSGVPPIPEMGDVWTVEQAEKAILDDFKEVEHYLNAWIKVPLKQYQVDALVLDTFQHGAGNLKKDLIHKLNRRDFAGVSDAIRHRQAPGSGLKRRYAIIADIFGGSRPDPKIW